MATKQEFSTHVRKLFNVKTFREELNPLVHALLGVAGELGEFRVAQRQYMAERETDCGALLATHDNFVKEAGDVMFYCEAGAQALPPHNQPVEIVGVAPTHDEAFEGLFGAIDVVKKAWSYNRPLNPGDVVVVALALHTCERYVAWETFNTADVSSEGVRAANVVKLQARYPKGEFDSGDAVAQADKVAK